MAYTLEPGEALAAGRYRIDGVLGSGGMAQVYRAYDTQLARPVAVKTMRPGLGAVLDAGFPARFRREARAMAALTHPNVVAVHDTGEEPRPDGQPMPYFVMELVVGESLADRLRATGPLPPADAVRITGQVLAALAASHASGLVHRDIKPANVLLRADGTAKVADFGIVRAASGGGTDSGTAGGTGIGTALTGTSMTPGTPQYMSPEQVRGDAVLDGRSDLYAVGVLLFEMLTGRVPFDGDHGFAIGYRHVTERPPTLTEAGVAGQPELEAVLERALAKSPEERYADATAMRAALPAPAPAPAPPAPAPVSPAPAPVPETLVQVPVQPPPFPTPHPPPHPLSPPPPAPRRRKPTGLIVAISAGGLLALAATGFGVYALLGEDDSGPPEATYQVVLPKALLDDTYARVDADYLRERAVGTKGPFLGKDSQGSKYTLSEYREKSPADEYDEDSFIVVGTSGRFEDPDGQRTGVLKNHSERKGARTVVRPQDYTPADGDLTVSCLALRLEDGDDISTLCAAADGNTLIQTETETASEPSADELAEAAERLYRVREEVREPIR